MLLWVKYAVLLVLWLALAVLTYTQPRYALAFLAATAFVIVSLLAWLLTAERAIIGYHRWFSVGYGARRLIVLLRQKVDALGDQLERERQEWHDERDALCQKLSEARQERDYHINEVARLQAKTGEPGQEQR